MGKQKSQQAGRELATSASVLDRIRDRNLADVKDMSFDELMKQLEDAGELVDAAHELGDGFHLLQGSDDKKKLIGVPFIIIDWQQNPGKFGGFITMRLKTAVPVVFDGHPYQNFIVNDGSKRSGIRRQVLDYPGTGAILVKKGLRVSEEYEVVEAYEDEHGDRQERPVLDPATGKPVLGTTFYLDLSA